LYKRIWTINLALNSERDKDWKEDLSEIAIPINTAFFRVSLKSSILLIYTDAWLPTRLITKAQSL
jgi:hypothetical protein